MDLKSTRSEFESPVAHQNRAMKSACPNCLTPSDLPVNIRPDWFVLCFSCAFIGVLAADMSVREATDRDFAEATEYARGWMYRKQNLVLINIYRKRFARHADMN